MAADRRYDRAVQFAPFAALRGYYELILSQEKSFEERRELGEEESAVISERLKCLETGVYVHVTYYNKTAYSTLSGMVGKVDYTYRFLTVNDRKIWFNDIIELKEYIPDGRETWLI